MLTCILVDDGLALNEIIKRLNGVVLLINAYLVIYSFQDIVFVFVGYYNG